MPADVKRFLERAREAKRESKYVEFKQQFDPASSAEWIELVKDFAAIVNIGGGVLVIGVANDGSPSGAPVQSVLDLDSAAICDKLRHFVGEDFDDFEVHDVRREGATVAAIVCGSAQESPLVFVQTGTYTDLRGRSKTAFSRGAVYFRHGAKSEPATSADLRAFIERRLATVREEWLSGIREVVSAPAGTEIVAIQRAEGAEGEPTRIRITSDQDAPVYGRIDWDASHPHRQTELIEAVNSRLPDRVTINSRDIQAVRRVYDINGQTHPEFAHQGRRELSPSYSEDFAEWLAEEFRRDGRFFDRARAEYAEILCRQG